MNDEEALRFRNQNLDRMRDHKFYLENFCKIKTKKRGLEPFILNEAQKDLFNTIRKNNRIILLKARQLGMSTAVTGYFYVDTIMNPGTTTALIGYNSSLTSELLDKVKVLYKSTPPALRPTIQYNSKYEISFPKIDSKIMVLPSTENVGSGYTLNNCLVTELAKIENAEEKMISLEPAVPVDGKLVIESSPKGVGNLYHRMWMLDNDYVKKEYGWWWGYSREDIEQIRRRINNPRVFAQEYGLEFLSSGRPVFDANVVKAQRVNVLKEGDYNGFFKVYKQDGWTFYQPTEQGMLYVIGADVSEGVEGGDYSTATVFNRKTGEEVAFYRGLIAADRFGETLNKIGRMYNNALMVVEINNHGLTTVTALKNFAYPSMYFRRASHESIGYNSTDRLGWRTTKVTRPLLIDELAQAMRDQVLTIHSKEILDEMTVFVYNDNNDMVPQNGFHDDAIFSTGIAFQGFKILYSGPLTQIDSSKHLPTSFAY